MLFHTQSGRTTLKDIVNEKPKLGETATQNYIVEKARRDASGAVTEGRIVTEKSYAEAAKSMMEYDPITGEVVYRACFAAGTLVYTENGPMLIEDIRAGMRVLSQPEDGGPQDYKPVLNCVTHYNQPVWVVRVSIVGQEFSTVVITTPNHPFWVEEKFTADGLHRLGPIQQWVAAECLEPGFMVQLADGERGLVTIAAQVRHTQYEGIGFAEDVRSFYGIPGVPLDLRTPQIVRQLRGELSIRTMTEYQSKTLQLGEPCLTTVYNFEVEDFHTYYVGGGGVGVGIEVGRGAEAGIWVHNTNCGQQAAIDRVVERVEIKAILEDGQAL